MKMSPDQRRQFVTAELEGARQNLRIALDMGPSAAAAAKAAQANIDIARAQTELAALDIELPPTPA